MSIDYNKAKTETQKEIEGLRKKYNEQIKDLKEQLKNMSNEIQGLYKDNFKKDEHIDKLQAELHTVKTKYYNKEQDLNAEVKRLNELLQQQDVQYHSVKAAEIEQLNQSIENLQSDKNALLLEIQQKQHEINNLKNMLTTSMSTAEKNQERLIKEKEDEAEKK